mmetsp:Transcript_24576/g.80561  ORF Transcript_24576/g.80561 Transcript_24576/m.80561 type:complete len:193 (-) Transcript_24576:110-688(-)
MVDEDILALMYELELERESIDQLRYGTHADLMGLAQSFLDLSNCPSYSVMDCMRKCRKLASDLSEKLQALMCLFPMKELICAVHGTARYSEGGRFSSPRADEAPRLPALSDPGERQREHGGGGCVAERNKQQDRESCKGSHESTREEDIWDKGTAKEMDWFAREEGRLRGDKRLARDRFLFCLRGTGLMEAR